MNEERGKEFIENLGKGKSMVEIEQEEPIVQEPDNPEDILESEINNLHPRKDMKKKDELQKQLFQFRCEQYSKHRKQHGELTIKASKDTEEIEKQIRELQVISSNIYADKYALEIKIISDETERLKGLIEETFPEEKTVKFEGIGMFTKKILKGIEIVNKDKLLAALIKKDMLSKGVKSFDTTFLKKAVELKLFSEDEVKGTEKPLLQFTEEKKNV